MHGLSEEHTNTRQTEMHDKEVKPPFDPRVPK